MNLLRDPVSSASHFLMAAIAVVITLFLTRLTRGDRRRRFYVLVFAFCMVLLYSASGLYHAVRLPADELLFFQLLDMSAIYLMIAGSVTPVAAILVRGRLRTVLLVGEWAMAAIGILALWMVGKPEHTVLVASYLGLAWFACAGMGHFWRAAGWTGAKWFLSALAIYIAGAVVDLLHWPVIWPGVVRAHEVLHFCDICGTACYLVFLIKYVIPFSPPDLVPETESPSGQRPARFATPGQA